MWIAIFTALFATVGLGLILSDVFRVPAYSVAKATHNLGKRQNRKTNPLELWLREVANRLSEKIRLNEYKRLQLEADLKTADINMTPEMYTANAIVKAGFIGLFAIPLAFLTRLLGILVLGISAFFSARTAPERAWSTIIASAAVSGDAGAANAGTESMVAVIRSSSIVFFINKHHPWIDSGGA